MVVDAHITWVKKQRLFCEVIFVGTKIGKLPFEDLTGNPTIFRDYYYVK
jgi:hypothetical protein